MASKLASREQLVRVPEQAYLLNRMVTLLAIGTARYGATDKRDGATGYFLPKYSDDEEEIGLLRAAIACGYNVIDTARAYGRAEELVGQAIKGYPRQNLLIVTKVGIRYVPDIRDQINKSIRSLETVPNVLMIHDRVKDQTEQVADRFILEVANAVEDGEAGALGISNFQPDELKHTIEITEGRVEFYQAKINLTSPRRDARELLKICRKNNIVFMASAALDRGKSLKTDGLNPIVLEIAEKYQITPAQVGIFAVSALGAWPIVQTHNREHMQENMDAIKFGMQRKDVERLKRLMIPASTMERTLEFLKVR